MKLRVVGGPVAGTLSLEVKSGDKFSDIFKKINKAIGDESVWGAFHLHPALLVEEEGSRRVRPMPHVIQPGETPKSLQLPQDGSAFVMLRPLGSPPPPMVPSRESAVTGESIIQARNANSRSPAADGNPNPGASYQDRLIAIYTKYQPEKLHTVNGTLKKFAGKEEAVIKQLVGKYGPEPRIEDAMREAAAVAAAVSNSPAATQVTPSRATNLDLSSVRGASTPPTNQSPAAMTPNPSPREMTYSVMTTPEPTPRETDSAGRDGASATPRANPNPHASYADRLTAIYAKYEPEKVQLVPGTLKKFAGREEAVLRSLVKKYGPEPVIDADGPPALSAESAPAAERKTVSAPLAPPPPSLPSAAVTPGAPVTPSPTASAPPPPPSENSLSTVSPGSATVPPEGLHPSPANLSYRDRLIAIYSSYQPDKLNTVEGNLRRFAGREEAMIQKLVQRYGPEPVPEVPPTAQVPAPTPPAEELRAPTPPPPPESEEPTDKQPESAERATAIPAEEEAPPTMEEDISAGEDDTAADSNQPPDNTPPSEDKPTLTFVCGHTVETGETAPLEDMVSTHGAAERTQEPPRTPTPPPSSPPPSVEATIALDGEKGEQAIDPATPLTHVAPMEEEGHPVTAVVTVAEEPAQSPAAGAPAPAPPATKATQPPSLPPASPPEAPPTHPPPSPPPQATQAPASPVQPSASKRQLGAIGTRCADFVSKQNGLAVQRRAFRSWLGFHDAHKATELVCSGLWEEDRETGVYRLADKIQPVYAVRDLTMHVQALRTPVAGAPRPFSDAMVLSLRAVLDALKKCLRSQAIDITSEEEKRIADGFLREWESERDMCPVQDSEKLAHALQQAARFLSQIEDLMNVTRSQDSQLGKLKDMHEQLQTRAADGHTMEAELKNLVDQLKESKQRQRSLEEALEAAKATASKSTPTPRGGAATTRSPSRRGVVSPRRGAKSAEDRPQPTSLEARQAAHIVHLQQELAKTRSLVNRSKTFEEKLKQQLEESEERQMRLRRVVAATSTVTLSASGRARSPRTGSAGGGISPRHTTGAAASVPQRASFSQPQLSPRRRNGGTPSGAVAGSSAGPTNSPEARQPRQAPLGSDEHASPSGASTSPWPKSRYVPPVPEIDRGPCPHCLTPLTSISPDVMGPATERAAFCFSCRRSFTFGELAHRDAAGPSQGLSYLWNSR